MSKKPTKQQKPTKQALFSQAAGKAHDSLRDLLTGIIILTDAQHQKIEMFLEAYTKCELIYKKLYPAYKRAKDGEIIDVKNLTININKIEAALRWCGILYSHDEVKAIFSADKAYTEVGNKACTLLRNSILHNRDTDSINEVLNRFDFLIEIMEQFIQNAIM